MDDWWNKVEKFHWLEVQVDRVKSALRYRRAIRMTFFWMENTKSERGRSALATTQGQKHERCRLFLTWGKVGIGATNVVQDPCK